MTIKLKDWCQIINNDNNHWLNVLVDIEKTDKQRFTDIENGTFESVRACFEILK